ncbi:MAG TPA: PKD domain-containing protein [Candidatus Gracilibacteria bacterium]|nr:PKD domain-containing protein [Candidatus Gracilibacteria bacterium]
MANGQGLPQGGQNQPGMPAQAPQSGTPVQQMPAQPVQSAPQVPVTPVVPPSAPTPVQPVNPTQAPAPAPMPAPAAMPVPAPQPAVKPVTPQPAPPAPAPVQMPQQPRPMQPQPMRPGQPGPARPGMPGAPGSAAIRKPPNPKKLIFGCAGCSGGAILLFIILVLIFVGQTTASGENPLARSLGMDTGTFINTLILLVNLIFGTVSVVLFLLAVVGMFRFFMARKDDKPARKKGVTQAGITGLLLLFIVFIWVGIYIFLSSRRVPVERAPTAAIMTEPENTIGLTAPITIKFDASNVPISPNTFDILSYAWDFRDGGTATVVAPSHEYKAIGRYDVLLQVTKRNKQSGEETVDEFTHTVVIANVEIDASFTATPERGPAPLTIAFDASGASAPAGEITSYEWDFNNDNNFTDGSGVTVEHEFTQVGAFKVNLRVTDNTGQFKVGTKEIVVESANIPTAVIEIPTTSGKYFVGQQYSFQAEKSTSPNGQIDKYEWIFGDGTKVANTRTATHTYKTAGDYEVTLTVTDETGSEGEASQKIKLETPESAPIAIITTVPPAADDEDFIIGTVPFEVSFNGTKSSDNDNNIVDYKWDFDGDGTDDDAGENVTYVYKTNGSFNATLTVIDAEGNESKSILVVRAGAQPLQARLAADPVEGVIPLTVTFDASSSSYPGGQIVSYEWDFGDGSAKRIDTSKVVYKYTKIGTFTASVTAIASDNTRSTAQTPVNVRPVPLTACFTPTTESGAAPLTVEFDPSCSTGTVAKYSWDFGDSQTSKTRKPSHTFVSPGSYQVTLEVADNQNVIDTFTKNILVTGSI